MVLVDTSVWIEIFRKRSPVRLESAVDFEDIVTCLPVIQEVLQGFQNEAAFRQARESMFALPMVESPLQRELFEEAIGLYRSARRQGLTIRSSIDCLIAVCAIRHNLMVLHKDRDFSQLAKISSLREESIHA